MSTCNSGYNKDWQRDAPGTQVKHNNTKALYDCMMRCHCKNVQSKMTGGTTHPLSDKYIRQASSAPSLHPFLMSNAPPSWEAVTGRHTCFHHTSLLLVILGYSQDVIHQPFRVAWHMSPRFPWSAPTPSLQLMHPGISQRRLGGQQEGPRCSAPSTVLCSHHLPGKTRPQYGPEKDITKLEQKWRKVKGLKNAGRYLKMLFFL